MGGLNSNAELRRLLEEIGWSPYELARAVNRLVSPDRRIHAKTPFAWRDRGTVPRDPLPAVVAGILTEARGEIVTVDQLWPGQAHKTEVWLPAVAQIAPDRWLPHDTLALLKEFRASGKAKTHFAVSGNELTSLAESWAFGNHALMSNRMTAGQGRITPDYIDYLEKDLAELRRLDDGHGGELVLRAVVNRLAEAIDLLSDSSYPADLGRRLLSLAGQMAQLAGWLGFDLGRHGFAQRMYLLGLRAAVAAGDKQLGALVLSCIAFQQTWRNRPHDAVSIMGTVQQGLRSATTPRVQALIAMREARAFATSGMHSETSAALERAHQALARGQHDHDPAWVYWMGPTVLTSEAGRCYLHLGDTLQAEQQLAEGLANLNQDATRDRVLYGLSLALAHARGTGGRQDLELACYEAGQVLPMLPEVGSARCRNLIDTINAELRPHRATSTVRTFIDKFETMKKAKIC
ncbi:hypothetical protein [Nocardia iowensis]|uniref:Transcriptional regulator n=1 Tax=Nocardia iowensis TaxID=204891 RepID=A0ABX8RQM7_NOCIO|nr:hypothetical protein [Nocardia iowensis]QXN91938.1 hypothetical protein KV110_01735 [Nocardia iowensis]